MGVSKSEFMDVRIMSEDYHDLPDYIKSNIEIKVIDVKGFDYSEDELHQELKKNSDKAFKELKKREFYLRHKKTNKDEI